MFGFTSWSDFTQKATEGLQKAGNKAKDLSSKISADVNNFVTEQKKQYHELNQETELKERQKLKHSKVLSTGHPPWFIDTNINNHNVDIDINNEIYDELKLNILKICKEVKSLLIEAPKSDSVFDFKLEYALPYANCVLKLDPILPQIRFKLVPQHVSEEQFWRNYFYRVQVIRESMGVARLDLSSLPISNANIINVPGNSNSYEGENACTATKVEKKEQKLPNNENIEEGDDTVVHLSSKQISSSSTDLLPKDMILDDEESIDAMIMDVAEDDDEFYSDEIHIDSLSDAQRLKMKKELGLSEVLDTNVNNVLSVVNVEEYIVEEIDDKEDENVDDMLANLDIDINVDDISDISDGEINDMVESENIL